MFKQLSNLRCIQWRICRVCQETSPPATRWKLWWNHSLCEMQCLSHHTVMQCSKIGCIFMLWYKTGIPWSMPNADQCHQSFCHDLWLRMYWQPICIVWRSVCRQICHCTQVSHTWSQLNPGPPIHFSHSDYLPITILPSWSSLIRNQLTSMHSKHGRNVSVEDWSKFNY